MKFSVIPVTGPSIGLILITYMLGVGWFYDDSTGESRKKGGNLGRFWI